MLDTVAVTTVLQELGYTVTSSAKGITVARVAGDRYIVFKDQGSSLEAHAKLSQKTLLAGFSASTALELRVLRGKAGDDWLTIKVAAEHEDDLRELAPVLDQLARQLTTPTA